jgi:hypothetical protein
VWNVTHEDWLLAGDQFLLTTLLALNVHDEFQA